MAVNANTNKSYDVTTLREDLQDALISITPTDTPFMSMCGSRSAENTNFEWPTLALAAVDGSNRVLEGEAAPGNDAPTNAVRLNNYTQISDKVVEVSSTNQAVNGVADNQKMAKQVAHKLKELKRDMETMLLANVAANAGAAGTARVTAGFPAFLTTNVDRGSGGADGTLSGSTSGYVNAAAQDGTLRALTEAQLRTVVHDCWNNGASPTTILCGGLVKQKISSTFTGGATKYQQQSSETLNTAIDVYVSDFGRLQVVPTRFGRARDVLVIDPEYIRIAWLQKTKQEPLAKTGHAERRLISCEYGLQVDTELAHGCIADINGAL